MEIIDARGLDCPQPLILLQNAIEKSHASSYQVLATCGAAKDNITSFAQKLGYTVQAEQNGREVKLTLNK